ncbi:MAG: FtsX-like permease family protein [Dehalococcoidia bacterium]|nr:FtsX-like permease family protein [Dehalococcoidia bacterium]
MVSVARRNLFQDKTRLIVSVGGVAFALLLVLALDAIFTGSMNRITAYIDRSGADIWVAQEGVRNMHMASSFLPLSKVEQIKGVPGVAEVHPILYTSNIMTNGESRNLVYLIGIGPQAKVGGPWKMRSGVPDVNKGEVIVDKAIANKMGIGVGDTVEIVGNRFTLKGLSEDASSLVSSVAFISFDEFARIRQSAGVASYLLVTVKGGASPGQVAERIQREVGGLTANTTSAFSEEERKVVRDMSAELIAMMNFTGFLIGMAVTGLTLYTATVLKLKEYGIIKAIGATNRWLYLVVMEQAFLSIALGFSVALALTFVLGYAVSAVAPLVAMEVAPDSVAKALVVAVLIGVLASIMPVRKIAAIDPARVFRG